MSSKLKLVVLAVLPLALSACGEGWEQIRTEAFPYGNQRTAGTGVAYVRSALMPERELNLEPLHASKTKAVSSAEESDDKSKVLNELRQIFREEQEK